VSSLMELVNELYAFSEKTARGGPGRPASANGQVERPETIGALREALDSLVLMVSPFAPHTAEEMWQRLGHPESLVRAAWPAFDEAVAKADTLVVPVQINGKVRARLTVTAGLSDEDLRAAALADPAVASYTNGKTIRKVVVAKGPLVSLVVS